MKPTFFILLVLIAGQAKADTIYTNQADFLAAAGPTIQESYETYPATDRTNEITTDYFTVTTESLAQAPATIYIRDEPSEGLLHATHGEKYLVMGHSPATPTEQASRLTFYFDHPITALGMTIVDFGDHGTGPLLFDNNQIAVAPLADGNELFFGIVADDPFTQITLDKMTAKDGIGIDEMYFTTVPEPSTLFLLLSVFLLAAGRHLLTSPQTTIK